MSLSRVFFPEDKKEVGSMSGDEIKVSLSKFKARGVEKGKLVIEWNGKTINVWDVESEEVLSPFVENAVVYKHKIAVGCDGKIAHFDFHGSVHEYQNRKDRYDTIEDLILVFEAILGDAVTYLNSKDIDDMASELGITKPSEAIRVWNGCKNTHKKLKRVLRISDDEFFDLSNALIDYINENV
ncbi:MAG: hypothetical protein ACXQS2_04335 [Methermicoccaceae archaeon]